MGLDDRSMSSTEEIRVAMVSIVVVLLFIIIEWIQLAYHR